MLGHKIHSRFQKAQAAVFLTLDSLTQLFPSKCRTNPLRFRVDLDPVRQVGTFPTQAFLLFQADHRLMTRGHMSKHG
tara:strand:+ start:66 stop:296 length:231 start_codon:yes stop_codon:yes gene_type:complete